LAITNLLVPAEGTTDATGNQDDFDFGNAGVLRCDNATLVTFRGLAAGRAGQRLTIFSVGAGQVDFSNEDANSAAQNRILNGVSGTISLSPGSGQIELEYDGTSARWRVVTHEQGAWIAPPFAATDFTANGSMTWTVDAGDVRGFAYHLRGRTLSIVFEVLNTSLGGTPSDRLLIKIPGGFTAARSSEALTYYIDNTTRGIGRAFWANGSTNLTLVNFTNVNWSLGTNQTTVIGQLFLDVQ
jgi:hypothetical protein